MASSRKIMAKTHDDGVLDGVLDVLIAHPILLRVPLETGRHGEASPVNFSGNNRLSRMFSPCCPPRSRMALLQSSSPFRTSRPGCDLSATVTVASRGLARWQQWPSDLQSIMRRSKNARNPLDFFRSATAKPERLQRHAEFFLIPAAGFHGILGSEPLTKSLQQLVSPAQSVKQPCLKPTAPPTYVPGSFGRAPRSRLRPAQLQSYCSNCCTQSLTPLRRSLVKS